MVKIQPKEIPLVVLLLTDKIFLWWQYQEMVLLEYAYEEPTSGRFHVEIETKGIFINLFGCSIIW